MEQLRAAEHLLVEFRAKPENVPGGSASDRNDPSVPVVQLLHVTHRGSQEPQHVQMQAEQRYSIWARQQARANWQGRHQNISLWRLWAISPPTGPPAATVWNAVLMECGLRFTKPAFRKEQRAN